MKMLAPRGNVDEYPSSCPSTLFSASRGTTFAVIMFSQGDATPPPLNYVVQLEIGLLRLGFAGMQSRESHDYDMRDHNKYTPSTHRTRRPPLPRLLSPCPFARVLVYASALLCFFLVLNVGYRNPLEQGISYEDMYMPTLDGLTIHGWLLKSPDAHKVQITRGILLRFF